MGKLTKDDIDKVAVEYLNLQKKAKEGKKEDVYKFEAYQNFCMKKLEDLVLCHVKKYYAFPNYQDLKQDGFEALFNAFGTYNPEKGCFSWWASKYIKTRVKRRANNHSTFKIPIRTARKIRPYKTSNMPITIDKGLTPLEKIEKNENCEKIKCAIELLDETKRLVINMKYGFNGIKKRPVREILEELDISIQKYIKLIAEAEKQIKKHLLRVE